MTNFVSPVDAPVDASVMSVACGVGPMTLAKYIRQGRIPQHDVEGVGKARLWRLKNLRSWNPPIAARCERLLAALADPE